jgi:hypothetical protein
MSLPPENHKGSDAPAALGVIRSDGGEVNFKMHT